MDEWSIYSKLDMCRSLAKLYERERQSRITESKKAESDNNALIARTKKEIEKLQYKYGRSGTDALVKNLLKQYPELSYLENEENENILHELKKKLYDKTVLMGKIQLSRKLNERNLNQYGVNLTNLQSRDERKEYRTGLDNRTQHFNLKFNTARNLEAIYRKMIDLMTEDQFRFQNITESLEKDAKIQRNWYLKARAVKELATGQAYQLLDEFNERFQLNQQEINLQSDNVRDISNQIQILTDECQLLIRSENLQKESLGVASQVSIHESQLERDIKNLNERLQLMKEVTLVPDFDGILPRLVEQLKQNNFLEEELNLGSDKLSLMITKKNHGYIILTDTENRGLEKRAMFEIRKQNLEENFATDFIEPMKATLIKQDQVIRKIMYLHGGLRRLRKIGLSLQMAEQEIGQSLEIEDNEAEDKGSIPERARDLLNWLISLSSRADEFVQGKIRDEDKAKALSALSKRLERLKTLLNKTDNYQQASLATEVIGDDSDVFEWKDVKAASKKICDLAAADAFSQPSDQKKR